MLFIFSKLHKNTYPKYPLKSGVMRVIWRSDKQVVFRATKPLKSVMVGPLSSL